MKIHVFHGFPISRSRIHRLIVPVQLPSVKAYMGKIPDGNHQKDKKDQIIPVDRIFLERPSFFVEKPERTAGNQIQNTKQIEI